VVSPIRKSLSSLTLLLIAAFGAWGLSAAMQDRAAPAENLKAWQSASGDTAKKEALDLHPVIIHTREGPPLVESGQHDLHGNAVMITCSTCHATREPNPQNRATADIDEFHKGLHTAHGGLSCLACHNRDDYDSLRAADGTRIEFADVMNLCAQCHGQQARDYRNGAHGGMTGYWDRSRGPRQRNNCIDCHDPHAPAYPEVMPVFRPKDGAKHLDH
jgi:nitrate reductase cytochrome c-type subunit